MSGLETLSSTKRHQIGPVSTIYLQWNIWGNGVFVRGRVGPVVGWYLKSTKEA